MGRTITRFQFETIKEQLEAGNQNWVDLRMSCGLTSEELQDILDNFEYYQEKFKPQEKEAPKKKPWWKFGKS